MLKIKKIALNPSLYLFSSGNKRPTSPRSSQASPQSAASSHPLRYPPLGPLRYRGMRRAPFRYWTQPPHEAPRRYRGLLRPPLRYRGVPLRYWTQPRTRHRGLLRPPLLYWRASLRYWTPPRTTLLSFGSRVTTRSCGHTSTPWTTLWPSSQGAHYNIYVYASIYIYLYINTYIHTYIDDTQLWAHFDTMDNTLAQLTGCALQYIYIRIYVYLLIYKYIYAYIY